VVALRTIVVALIGSAATAGLARLARRNGVAARLRPDPPRRRQLPSFLRARLADALDAAALTTTPESAVEVWGFAVLITAVVGLGLSPATSTFMGGAVAIGLPFGLVARGSRRARLVAASVPDGLELVGAELRAGGTVPGAIAAVANRDGPLAADMTRVRTRVRLGASLDDALHAWARERPVFGVDAAAGALALSTNVGGKAADALDGLAASLRERLAVAAEARSLSAQARYSAWVIGLLPVGWFVVAAVTDPRSLHSLVASDAGRVCAAVGLGLELLGVWWMRVILRGGGEW
jgi:tight adherence protein B